MKTTVSGVDIGAKIQEKLQRKLEQLEHKLADLDVDEELREALAQLEDDLADLERQLEFDLGGAEKAVPEMQARLEAKRERLLAKKERLELKKELLQEKRERLTEAIEGVQGSLNRQGAVSGGGPRPGKSLEEEQRKILELLQDGKINADEATKLLEALRQQERTGQSRTYKPRWVRIRVTDTNSDRVRVNMTFPIGVVRAGLRAGGRIAGIEGINTIDLEDLLNRGEAGHLVDAFDEEGGERVEIFVE